MLYLLIKTAICLVLQVSGHQGGFHFGKNFTPIWNFENSHSSKSEENVLVQYGSTNQVYVLKDKFIHSLMPDHYCYKTDIVRTLSIDEFAGLKISHPWPHSLFPDYVQKNCWALNVNLYRHKYTSEGGQDGVLEYIFYNIGTRSNFFVEFGWNTNMGANSYHLQMFHNFTGLLLDGGTKGMQENHLMRQHFITSTNIVELFRNYSVPIEPDYVSIDIDSADLWVFRAIVTSEFRPRVITVEYNINFPISSTITCDERCRVPWQGCKLFGSSFGALNMVAEEFGYKLVAVVERLDMVFVRKDELKNTEIPSIYQFEMHTGKPYLKSCTNKFGNFGTEYVKEHAVDYAVWRTTGGNWNASKISAQSQMLNMGLDI